MAIKTKFDGIKVTGDFDPYFLCGTEFQPNMFTRKISGHPQGGESVALCWTSDQAVCFLEQYMQYAPMLLCLNEKTMTMRYCYNIEQVREFYGPTN